MRAQKQDGMSLMEVAIIVTILGVLAAIVLSRLVFVSDEVRVASVSWLRGAFTGGINGAHSQWLAQSQPEKINLDGVELFLNNTGWPEAVSEKADGHATPEKCLEVWSAVLQNPPQAKVMCTGKCQYAVTTSQGAAGRDECVYINRQQKGDNAIYYDMATGFVR